MKPIHILLIDDSPDDIILISEAINDGKIAHTVDIANNGYEAIDFLNKQNSFENKKMPDLILLDINMPLMNGHEVLDIVKADEKLKHIPVIMLTTSASQSDILKSYRKYSNCYIVKPDNVNDFDKIVRSIENFWIEIAELPKDDH